MSGWQAYITNLLDSSDGIKRAAIVGYPDASVWARSEGPNEFKATEAELKKLVQQFGNLNDVPSTGADLEGVHYIVPRTEENLMFGKKDKTGFFAAKTAQGPCVVGRQLHLQPSKEDSVLRSIELVNEPNRSQETSVARAYGK